MCKITKLHTLELPKFRFDFICLEVPKLRFDDICLICKTVETFVFLHMCKSVLSNLTLNLLTGRVSVQNYFRSQIRSNPSLISVHAHSMSSTHSIPHLS